MKARLFLCLALVLICTGAALAQTPDGETPAEETVCDSETGAAYGLCNAYCEAMDCESDEPAASETACTKVQSKFLNITGRDLPCEAAASCPCAANSEWQAVLGGNVIQCEVEEGFVGVATNIGIASAGSDPTVGAFCGAARFPTSGFVLPITPEQAAVCIDLLAAYCIIPPED